MDDNGVTISFKEIYEELKKTTAHLSILSVRMDRIESRLEKQDNFSQKIKVAFVAALIPIGLAVIYFVAKEGGF